LLEDEAKFEMHVQKQIERLKGRTTMAEEEIKER